MATTQKGIYYPDDYTAVADVPEDMKDLAESVDTALGDLEDNIEQNIQPQIDDIEEEQTTQNNNIEALQIENTRLKATLPTTTGSGENITLSKTAELEFIQPPLPRGNSEQDNISYIDVGTWEQGGIDGSSGSDTVDSVVRTAEYITVVPNILYDISRSIYNAYNVYRFYDENKNYLGNQTTSGMVSTNQSDNRMVNGVSSMTMTILNSNVAYMRIVDNSNDLSIVYTISTASPNPSYPSAISNVTGDVEVLVQNKNRWDKDGTNFNGQTGVNNFNAKKVILDSAIGNNAYSLLTYNTRCVAYFKGEIGLSYNVSMDSGFVITAIKEIDDDGIITSTINTSNITLTKKSFAVMIRKSDSSDFTDSEATKLKDSIQIEPGTTATTYTPHKEQTYTFPLGTQRMYLGDYLADDGIHHVRGQKVLDGSEDWTNASSSSAPYRLVINDIKPSSSDNIIPNVKCTHFEAVKWNADFNTYTYLITMHSNNNYLAFRDTDITSLADWKTWLSTHNVTIEYELATEEITPYTTEQQQAYDEIKQAFSYEEQTNISGTSDESNPLFSVEAYQSIKLVLEEISNAVVALGGV